MNQSFIPLKLVFLFLIPVYLYGQNTDEVNDTDALYIKSIYDEALTSSKCYAWLHELTTQVGGRLSGSPQAAAAVEYTRQQLQNLGLDSVWLQPCMVPHWTRGAKEVVKIVDSPLGGGIDIPALALGNTIGTPATGITAAVVEVQSLDELKELGPQKLKGKIVFFNRPMDPRQLRTFNAYGGAVDQRVYGPAKAADQGALAVLVRSMTTRQDDVPHTGVSVFKEGDTNIPAVGISTNAANQLSNLLKRGEVKVYIKTNCQKYPDKPSFNVIGEIRGSQKPDEIILVGGHLDSWDVGRGAHDDGSGCVHSMEVMHLIKSMDYKPKRTIRCVLFMNEENGLAGGLEYAKVSNEKNEYHLAALESDAGGFSPRGFSCDGDKEKFKTFYKTVSDWLPLLEPYGLQLTTGGSGADISPLKSQKGLLIGLRPDSQRYFDYHHTHIDTIDAVNKRELELGAAAMMTMVYLIDKYGL